MKKFCTFRRFNAGNWEFIDIERERFDEAMFETQGNLQKIQLLEQNLQ